MLPIFALADHLLVISAVCVLMRAIRLVVRATEALTTILLILGQAHRPHILAVT